MSLQSHKGPASALSYRVVRDNCGSLTQLALVMTLQYTVAIIFTDTGEDTYFLFFFYNINAVKVLHCHSVDNV